jgi:hypothetical protein
LPEVHQVVLIEKRPEETAELDPAVGVRAVLDRVGDCVEGLFQPFVVGSFPSQLLLGPKGSEFQDLFHHDADGRWIGIGEICLPGFVTSARVGDQLSALDLKGGFAVGEGVRRGTVKSFAGQEFGKPGWIGQRSYGHLWGHN